MKWIDLFLVGMVLLLAACTQSPVQEAGDNAVPSEGPAQNLPAAAVPPTYTAAALPPAPVATFTPVLLPTFEAAQPTAVAPTPVAVLTATRTTVTLAPEAWKSLPVLPTSSSHWAEIYRHGLALGNNPRAFSKVGDCGSTPAWFLGDFDGNPQHYSLGPYTYLTEVITYFHGSYSRTSLAGRAGFNASSVFTALWADPQKCQRNETPLACEYRLNRPVIALVGLGANDVFHPERFEPQMRRIIEFSLEHGVIPVLTTKAGNEEGDGSINGKLAQLALEYDLPLWNYWAAVQDLPNRGLQEDGVHLTWESNHFDDPILMQSAWPVRNLTALQVLDILWRSLEGKPPAVPAQN